MKRKNTPSLIVKIMIPAVALSCVAAMLLHPVQAGTQRSLFKDASSLEKAESAPIVLPIVPDDETKLSGPPEEGESVVIDPVIIAEAEAAFYEEVESPDVAVSVTPSPSTTTSTAPSQVELVEEVPEEAGDSTMLQYAKADPEIQDAYDQGYRLVSGPRGVWEMENQENGATLPLVVSVDAEGRRYTVEAESGIVIYLDDQDRCLGFENRPLTPTPTPAP